MEPIQAATTVRVSRTPSEWKKMIMTARRNAKQSGQQVEIEFEKLGANRSSYYRWNREFGGGRKSPATAQVAKRKYTKRRHRVEHVVMQPAATTPQGIGAALSDRVVIIMGNANDLSIAFDRLGLRG